MHCTYRYKIVNTIKLVVVISLLMIPIVTCGQTDENIRTRILFLLDASGSMQNQWSTSNSETKMSSAKRILTEIVDSLDKLKNVEVALRVYGHQSPPTMRNCLDTRLEVGFSLSSASYIKTKLKTLRPKGITPIAYSLEKAGGDFPVVRGRNIIILMTDGEESCEGDPCKVALELEKRNVVLKHFVIGIGVEESAASAFDCMGSYFQVKDQTNMKNVLNLILTRILNKTTSQVDLLDKDGKPTETDAGMSFYNSHNNLRKYDLFHSLNALGFPDTLSIDPVTPYNLVVHTLPPVTKEKIQLTPQIHNHIKVDAAQGYLQIVLQGKTINNNLNNKIKCLVRKENNSALVNVQNANVSEKYLVGKYDLELLTLPRTYLKSVDIAQNKTTTIEISTPGITNLVKKYEVYGGIFILADHKLEKIYELNANAKNETIALNPGKYIIMYRPKYSKSMHHSKSIEFLITSGESISLNL